MGSEKASTRDEQTRRAADAARREREVQPSPGGGKPFAMSGEVIDSAELAKRLNVPETWVRSRTNAKRTRDPIPHLRLGRYVRFSWDSAELREWLDRQLVSANGAGH